MLDAMADPPPELNRKQLPAALFFDVDGTLVGLQDDPDAVRIPTRTLSVLRMLQYELDGALAVVSGRSLDALDRLLSPLQLPAGAVHGGVIRCSNGAILRAQAPDMRAIELEARRFVDENPGTRLEAKGGLSVALHYRLAPEAEPRVLEFARLIAQRQPGCTTLRGRDVVEVKASGFDKGTAVRTLMQDRRFRGRHPWFVGDDLTDEDGFRAVQESGGTGIVVGGRVETAAQYRLSDHQAVGHWLATGVGPGAA